MAQQIIDWLKQRKNTTIQLQKKEAISTPVVPDKAYLGTKEGVFQKRYLNQKQFFQKQVKCENHLGKVYLGT